MATSATPHLFWITSRAAGIVALVLASLAVSLGLLMSTKLLRKRGPDLLTFHEVLSMATLAAIAVHGVTLLGDRYLHPSLVDIAVPFASGYRTFWTSLGIIGGWGMALLGLAFYVRRYIGAARWRQLHRLTALMWLAGLGHALGEGTDAGQTWFLVMMAIVTVPAVLLLATRWLGVSPPAKAAPPPRDHDVLDVRAIRVGTVPPGPVPVSEPAPVAPLPAPVGAREPQREHGSVHRPALGRGPRKAHPGRRGNAAGTGSLAGRRPRVDLEG